MDGVSDFADKAASKIDQVQEVAAETQADIEDTLDETVQEAEERTSSIEDLQNKMEEAKNKVERGQVLEGAAEAATEIGEATGNESLLGTG